MIRQGDHASRTKALARNVALVALLAAGLAVVGFADPSLLKTAPASGSTAPSSPPVTVCGNSSLLTGPSSAPPGAVSVPAGDNSALFAGTLPASETYWFAPGMHTLGSGEFAQIDAANNDTLIGGPGAVIDGQDKNDFAIAGSGTNVTIEYLTIEDFTAPQSQGAVNQNLSSGWVIENSTIEDNPYGAGVMVDSDGVLNDDCLTKNGQYGFQTYSGNDSVPVTNLTITNNEISDNDTQNYDTDGTGTCGCTGGAKFWNDLGATVTGNYIHDNESVGLWMDTNNTGFDVSDNYFSHNWDVAIQYEISYNVSITDNTFVDNGWIAGPNNPGTGAIEINNAGSDANVHSAYDTESVISGNVLTDNWGGVDIYEDSDRFCGTQSDNTSSDYCTLDDPSVYSCPRARPTTQPRPPPARAPTTTTTAAGRARTSRSPTTRSTSRRRNIGPDCTAAKGCGFIGLYSEWGTMPPIRRLRRAAEPGQQAEGRLQRQHLQRPVRVRLHVPGRHRELGAVERWLHRPQLERRHHGPRRRVDIQRVGDESDDHHHDGRSDYHHDGRSDYHHDDHDRGSDHYDDPANHRDGPATDDSFGGVNWGDWRGRLLDSPLRRRRRSAR